MRPRFPALLMLALWVTCMSVKGDELAGDFDDNGGVDFVDFSLFMEAFGSVDPRFDLNGSGRVDFEDLFLFADRFGEGTALERARHDSVFAARLDSIVQRVLAVAKGDTMVTPLPPTAASDSSEVQEELEPVVPEEYEPLVQEEVQSQVQEEVEPEAQEEVLSQVQEQEAVEETEVAEEMEAVEEAETVEEMEPVEETEIVEETVAVEAVKVVVEEILPPQYHIVRDGPRIRIFLPAYTIAIQGASPFGIVSLKLNGQAPDFAHAELPLGDWEWFWYRQADTSDQWLAAKLLQQDWGEPEIVEESDRILLRYQRTNTTETGADLAVTYRLPIVGSRFGIDYTIVNGTQSELEKPYIMVGFPGFSNQGFIEEVADAVATRTVNPPHTSFQQEAIHQSAPEILLLRHDVDPAAANSGSLEGTVKLRFGTSTYRLTTTFTPDPKTVWVYSAHTNKPLYLTSHLYAFLNNLESGVRTELGVEYELARE